MVGVTLTSTQLVHRPTATRIQHGFLNPSGLQIIWYIRYYMSVFVFYDVIYATQEYL